MSDDLNPDLEVGKGESARVKGALAMRLHGATYADIARIQEYDSPQSAQRAVEAALAAQATTQDKRHLLTLTNMRLERLLGPSMKKAVDPKHPEQQTATITTLKILDRQAKLLGLDQPTEVTVNNPRAAEIERWVRLAVEASKPDLPQEEEIIDVEILPGENEAVDDQAGGSSG